MPVLLGFLACEKVIFERDTNKVTIVNVLHDVFVPVIRGVQIPPNTLAPLNWTSFSMWYRAPTDGNFWWEQVSVLEGEQGERLLESEPLRFQMTAHQVMRVVSNFTHFPTYRESQCVLKLYSRNLGLTPDIGPASQWTEMMSYPIALHHTFYPQ